MMSEIKKAVAVSAVAVLAATGCTRTEPDKVEPLAGKHAIEQQKRQVVDPLEAANARARAQRDAIEKQADGPPPSDKQ